MLYKLLYWGLSFMEPKRIIEMARFIVKEGATIRFTADVFGVPKSVVHTCVTKRLYSIDLELYEKVQKVLKANKAERHLRGGIATRRMWVIRKGRDTN